MCENNYKTKHILKEHFIDVSSVPFSSIEFDGCIGNVSKMLESGWTGHFTNKFLHKERITKIVNGVEHTALCIKPLERYIFRKNDGSGMIIVVDYDKNYTIQAGIVRFEQKFRASIVKYSPENLYINKEETVDDLLEKLIKLTHCEPLKKQITKEELSNCEIFSIMDFIKDQEEFKKQFLLKL